MTRGATSVGGAAIASVMGVLCIGCVSPEEDGLAFSKYQEVQAVYVGASGTTPPVLINRNWGSIEKATGAVRPWNQYWSSTTGKKNAGNCGATFVTATHAITAAHCVDAEAIVDGIQIEQINAYGMTDAKFRSQDDVIITPGYSDWPFYWRPNQLVAGDGYVVNNGNGKMACTVKRRCHTDYGPEISCPSGNSGVDIAVLECPGRPSIMGSDAVFVTLAASDDGNTSDDGDNIEIFWFHEVVDLYAGSAGGSTTPTNNDDHYYLRSSADLENNYHYYTAHGRHQLIPVRSRYRNGIRYESLGPRNVWTTVTNAPICHGTSGSGAFKKRASDGAIHFVGPMVHGWLTDSSGQSYSIGTLCHDMANTFSRSSYVSLAYTARMVAGL